MSKIDKLIAELCPAGVEFTELRSVATYSSTRIDASELDETTFVGVDNLLPNTSGKTIATYTANTSRLTAYEVGDILLGNIRPYLKKIWLATNRGGCSGDVLAIRIANAHRSRLMPEFLYLLLASDDFFAYDMQHAKGAKMPRGSKEAILKYRIPIPPCEVQREIVKMLDAFTRLGAELDAEMESRKKQYSYYRDTLLQFEKNSSAQSLVRWGTLGELTTIVRGASPRPIQSFVTNSESGIPWIKIGDVPTDGKYITKTAQRVTPAGAEKSRRVFPGDFLLSNSMSFGRPYITKIEGCIHDGWLSISSFKDSFLPDFLYHLLRSTPIQQEFYRRAGAGVVQNLNADIVRSVSVPIPTLEEQARISNLLDKFETLLNDPVIGLPAEIKARRQQYEHYRSRLLTFKEAA